MSSQTFWSDEIKINFVSATMNQKVESLGGRLMKDYIKVGFNLPEADSSGKIDSQ